MFKERAHRFTTEETHVQTITQLKAYGSRQNDLKHVTGKGNSAEAQRQNRIQNCLKTLRGKFCRNLRTKKGGGRGNVRFFKGKTLPKIQAFSMGRFENKYLKA